MSFGQRLKKLRKEQGLTQQAMADRLGVTPTAIKKWEAGNNFVSEKNIYGIMETLGCTPNELFGIPENHPDRKFMNLTQDQKKVVLKVSDALYDKLK